MTQRKQSRPPWRSWTEKADGQENFVHLLVLVVPCCCSGVSSEYQWIESQRMAVHPHDRRPSISHAQWQENLLNTWTEVKVWQPLKYWKEVAWLMEYVWLWHITASKHLIFISGSATCMLSFIHVRQQLSYLHIFLIIIMILWICHCYATVLTNKSTIIRNQWQ